MSAALAVTPGERDNERAIAFPGGLASLCRRPRPRSNGGVVNDLSFAEEEL
jgi:hypothetical protein